MKKYYPSVKLIEEKCIGCTDCIKRCPTQAIRVRKGKAYIINDKCIDCGMCIKVCSNKAKKATTDSIDDVLNSDFKIKIAIPAPTFYSQFKEVLDINVILSAIKKIGFTDVYEVAKAAEIITEESAKLLSKKSINKPVISSACPAIVRLIQIRFPSLINHLLPIISPMEAMGKIVKEYYKQKGIDPSEVGVFFITPCAAKATNIRNPLVINKSSIDGVVSIHDIYYKIAPFINKMKNIEVLKMSSNEGIKWAQNGGECEALGFENIVSVDGIDNVISIFENVENGLMEDVDYIEALACTGGCLGGPLTVVNSFIARNKMTKVLNYNKNNNNNRKFDFDYSKINYNWEMKLNPQSPFKLDDDIEKAINKINQIEEIYNKLPKIDCGSCGAPTCKALAEDIVLGKANIEDCIFMLRDKVKQVAQEMVNLAEKLPPSIGDNEKFEK